MPVLGFVGMARRRKVPVAEQALAKQECKFYYCDASLYDFDAWAASVIDHRIPPRFGGGSELKDVVACCALCNNFER